MTELPGAEVPSLDDFELMARQAYAGLPEEFRAYCGHIGFIVADFPDQETLDAMGIGSPYELLGLFHGIGMAQGGDAAYTGQMPNRIWLYRRPILAYWAEGTASLKDIVTHVLVHEIGHHFGLSDADMEAIEAEAGDGE